MLSSVGINGINVSPSTCLHLSPSAARSPGCMLARVRIYLSPSMCLHLSRSAARLPGRVKASVLIYFSPSTARPPGHVPSFVPERCQIAGSHAGQCAHLLVSPVCASTCLPALPDRGLPARSCQCAHLLVSPYVPSGVSQRCQIAGPHEGQWAHLFFSRYVPSFLFQCCQIARPHEGQCAHLLVSQHVPSFAPQWPVCAFAQRAFVFAGLVSHKLLAHKSVAFFHTYFCDCLVLWLTPQKRCFKGGCGHCYCCSQLHSGSKDVADTRHGPIKVVRAADWQGKQAVGIQTRGTKRFKGRPPARARARTGQTRGPSTPAATDKPDDNKAAPMGGKDLTK